LRNANWITPSSHTSARAKKELFQLDNLHQEQDEDDEKDDRDSAASVVAESWSHTITTEAEHQNQDDQK
jgi:hypothetical protein